MNRKDNSLRTKKIAASAMLSALGVVVLYLGSVITVLDLTAVAFASFAVFFAVLELGRPFQYLIYAATAVLALLILPDKFSAFAYILFGGIYPIVKNLIEKSGKLLQWVFKFIYFNAVLTALIAVSVYVLHIDSSELGFGIVIYVLGNFAFFMYDIACTVLLTAYLTKFRQRLKIDKFFK